MVSKRSKSMIGGIAFAAVLSVTVIGIATLISPAVAENHRHSSVTGFFGLDDDGLPIVDRHGIMLVFDGSIAPETVSVNTFEVSLNDGSFAEVIETRVDGAYVFMRLEDELASDATPIVAIAEGEEIEDLAGNSTNKRKLGFVQIKDGIAPRLTVTLSGGSGTGTGDEGPDRLTNGSIDVHLVSDEPLQGAPRIVVVCAGLRWVEMDGSRKIEREIDDFMANRHGPHPRAPGEPTETNYTCGYDADGDGEDDPFELTQDYGQFRPVANWRSTWQNPQGEATRLRDGKLIVVVYARDRSEYERFGETVSNWSTATAGFGLDTSFDGDPSAEGVRVHPPDGSVVREKRPFVLLEFPEETNVDLASAEFDGENVLDAFEVVDGNKFVYWPLSMNQGEHDVEVDVVDAAGNEISFDFEFETTQRGDFVLPLVAGWNAVSVPADPIDPKIENVFTDPAIETVISWDRYGLYTPWAVSLRNADIWGSLEGFGAVSEIRAGRGYIVRATKFTEQPIALRRDVVTLPKGGCQDYGAWDLVGVYDEDGDQTENHYGEMLRGNDGAEVTAREYLGYYTRAFTWDPIGNQYEKLNPSDAMTIGEGVWVYGGGLAMCP
ncbi:MAG: DUF4179 domain-containing protein [Chloroflexi bacterium]|nr:DUF4179 domain-containing protein [Chloroflexota bacterium]